MTTELQQAEQFIRERGRECVDNIIFDLTDRGGFDGWWGNIDDEYQGEVKGEILSRVTAFANQLLADYAGSRWVREQCEWDQEEEDSNTFATACGQAFTLEEGTPEYNNMKFCCFCGGSIPTYTPTEQHRQYPRKPRTNQGDGRRHEGASMNTAETFEWLRERSNRLDEVEADNARLTEENVRLQLEIAQLRTKPLRDKLLEPQDMTEVMQMRFQKEQP